MRSRFGSRRSLWGTLRTACFTVPSIATDFAVTPPTLNRAVARPPFDAVWNRNYDVLSSLDFKR